MKQKLVLTCHPAQKMVLKAVVKALKKADKLKEKIQVNKDLLTDNETWLTQQQLQRIYQQVLILDLEYALDKKVEQDLWNYGFKNFIANLQNAAKDKKNPKHSESQAMLYWCLEAAGGFYLTLLHEICSAFDLDLPFRRKGNIYGCNKNISTIDIHCQPNKSSCYYICQHCLVHLGDIARYRNQSRQAEVFYRYAVQLSPSSGQPYNQLAILEASRGDKLSTVYHYVRSVALRHPFSVASTNLSRTLNKHAEEVVKLEGHNKLSCYEYVTTFLKLHGLLHSNMELETAEKLVQILATSLTAHIATESLSCWKLVQMVTINIFALHNARGSVDGNLKTFPDNELTLYEQKIEILIMDFLAACLTAFLLPVYTIKSGDLLLDYFAMPAVKLTLEWIRQEPNVLEKSSFKNRLQIWPSLCKVLNDIQPTIMDFPAQNYAHVPLPEDRDLHGFLPFEKCFQNLKFHTEDLKIDTQALNKLRACRLVDFGVWLCDQTGLNIITCSKKPGSSEDNFIYHFEAIGSQEPPSGEQIKEIEEMILTKFPSPTPSEASGSITGASTPDSSGFFSSILMNPQAKFRSSDFSSQENLLEEKRPGILKCQNSAEKIEKGAKSQPMTNRGHRNVALQAIINKNTEETKQVTFKTPSPTKQTGSLHFNKKQNNSKAEEQKHMKTEDVKKDKKPSPGGKGDWNSLKGPVKGDNHGESDNNDSQQKLVDGLNTRTNKNAVKPEPESGKDGKKKDKVKENPFLEFMTAFPPLPNVKDGYKNSNTKLPEKFRESEKHEEKIIEEENNQKNMSKQQLLSELFSKSKVTDSEQKQPHNMSGLLNLSKQQQKMLTDSKLVRNNMVQQQFQQQQHQGQFQLPQSTQSQQMQQKNFNKSDFPNLQSSAAIQKLKCVDKMEVARKEYEAAMFAMQNKQGQEPQRHFQVGPEPDAGQYDYERHVNLQQSSLQPPLQQQTQPQLYVRVNQPLINVGNYGFKYPTQFFLPWQEPQEPPLPPSWWSETPQSHQQQQQIDLNDVSFYQEAFPYNEKPNFQFDWSFQPYSSNFPIYVPPPVLETAYEDVHAYQISDGFGPGLQMNSRDSVYSNHPQQNSNVQPLGVGNNSYSLFSTSSWGAIRAGENDPDQSYGLSSGMMAQQSFWSGPGPSPLERLLEQQKQMRKEVPDPKNGT
ncbi:hypothetical protein RUM44_013300 [Polyplax serrata]|uniref:SMG7 n=1 Tax=Polyplax serrata TaxID=468196 RepID=A0ABR1BI46_POLSC